MRPIAFVATLTLGAAAFGAGCFDPDFQQGVPCSADGECPEGQVCNADNLCFDESDIEECTPEAFIACTDSSTAQFCEASGASTESTACGEPGCNETAGRCNECVPDTVTCNGDVLETCGPDGLVSDSQTCAAGCVEASTSSDARCAYLSPKFLPDICDELAADESFVVTSDGSIDSDLDTNCNGDIVTQTDGPEICVLRYGSFQIQAGNELTFVGSRAVAIVADTAIEILGALDVSADRSSSGPGGGTITSGVSPADETGGGGAGFRVAGAAGGSNVTGGGGSGGDAVDVLPLQSLIGGPKAASRFISPKFYAGGGGGGALTLIACRGSVVVGSDGLIDAGGGGGDGGDQGPAAGGGTVQLGARGGGAGGQLVIQALDVQLEGELYANGGAGGGGSEDANPGTPGSDGTRSLTPATGGPAAGAGGDGGDGGSASAGPGEGLGHGAGEVSAGGGGGSPGFIRVVAPNGVSLTLEPNVVSPALSPTEVGQTR